MKICLVFFSLLILPTLEDKKESGSSNSSKEDQAYGEKTIKHYSSKASKTKEVSNKTHIQVYRYKYVENACFFSFKISFSAPYKIANVTVQSVNVGVNLVDWDTLAVDVLEEMGNTSTANHD